MRNQIETILNKYFDRWTVVSAPLGTVHIYLDRRKMKIAIAMEITEALPDHYTWYTFDLDYLSNRINKKKWVKL